jgi:hypothetical protein
MRAISREKSSLKVESTREKKGGKKKSDLTTRTSRALGVVQSTLGVGGCGNICFGHELVAVRQGQRRNAVATGEGRLGRCTAGQS